MKKMKKKLIFLTAFLSLIFLSSLGLSLENTIEFNDYSLTYSYSESQAQSGEEFTLTIFLENTLNTDKTNVELTFDEEDPFNFNDDDVSFNTLKPGEIKRETFKIEIDEDARSTTYNIDFTLEDDDEKYEDTIEIKVDSIEPVLIYADITSSPLEITPDLKDIKLTIIIENTGEGDANFVRAKLNLPNKITPSNSYSDITNLGTIPAASSKTANFYIDTDKELEKNDYSLTLDLEYQNEKNQQRTSSLNIPLPLKGKPIFEITQTSTTPNKILSGSENNKLNILIKNIGTVKGEETSIRIFEQVDSPFKFNEKTQRIGNIEPGSLGEGVLTFEVEDTANEKTYILEFQTRTVTNNNVITESYTIPIKVNKQESNPLFTFIIIAIVVLVLLMFALIFLLRR